MYYIALRYNTPDICDYSRNVENNRLRLVFSTFPSCSQMPVVVYRSAMNTRLRLLYLLNEAVLDVLTLRVPLLSRGRYLRVFLTKVNFCFSFRRVEKNNRIQNENHELRIAE